MDKLIPLIDYILEQDLPQPIGRTAGQMVKYALFLKQKLDLWMFVPCKLVDGIWIALEYNPMFPDYEMVKEIALKETTEKSSDTHNLYIELKEYQEAKDRCLFDGIKYTPAKNKDSYDIVRICKETSVINYPKFWKDKTVESLIPYNLILTETAKKIINS